VAGAQSKQLKARIRARFWNDQVKDADGEFVHRYNQQHPLVEVQVRITRAGATLLDEKLKPPNGVNTISLDRFIAQLSENIDKGAAKAEPNGLFTLTLTPGPDQLCNIPAGPSLTAPAKAPDGQDFETRYRPLIMTFALDAALKVTTATVTSGGGKRAPNGRVVVTTQKDGQLLDVDWRFDWLRRVKAMVRPKTGNRDGAKVTIVALHQTGNQPFLQHKAFSPIFTTLDSFTDEPRPEKTTPDGKVIKAIPGGLGTHYVVDVDGHVVKVGDEKDFLSHAGHSAWGGESNVSKISVGIEHVHSTAQNGVFPEAQLVASLDLVSQLVSFHKVLASKLVGHADIKCIGPEDAKKNAENKRRAAFGGAVLSQSDRVNCPGVLFPWQRFEDAGLALKPAATATNYPFFVADAKLVLKEGAKGPNIKLVQQDLIKIGWPFSNSHPNENYDEIMATVVKRFQARFASRLGITRTTGTIDVNTALMIRRVVAALP
jgi:N-acetyl-anhydromuramyl-L-alanine amidase AmpD